MESPVLRGVFSVLMTERGVLTLPARLRDAPGRPLDGSPVLTVAREQCLRLFPMAMWEEIERKLMALPSMNPNVRGMQRLTIGHASELKIDAQGRFTVAPELREFAELQRSVVLVGQGSHVDIWDRERWELLGNDPSTSDAQEQVAAPRVLAIPASMQILSLVQADPKLLRSLGPEDLETLVCERLERMGFVSTRIGGTREADGGVDMIICPKAKTAFPFLLAVQVKSHRGGRKTPVSDVRDFAGTLRSQPVRGGVLVTNTSFSPDARWFAQQQQNLLHLRDFHDLSRWIRDEFAANEFYRELPSVLELRPGVTVRIHEWLREALGPGDE
jgi:MraZ protein